MIPNFRTGLGLDVHAFAEGRKLILAGIEIPYGKGLLGHSDADVLIHAICDSLLGALALGDIGIHFPDTDPKYKDASSTIFLKETKKLISEKGYTIGNIDVMLAMERPKIAPYLNIMIENLASILEIDKEQISVKATTTEKLGFIGRQEGVAAFATSLLIKD